jgi:hypothetical protein
VAVESGLVLLRSYYVCPECDLHFIHPRFHLTLGQELERYRLHQNSIHNPGYVKFLSVAVTCLKRCFQDGLDRSPTILDYGSGPVPVLVELLNREQFKAIGYDPFFGDRVVPGCVVTSTLEGQGGFDAVVSTEVVEHFRTPRSEWARMVALTRPGGYLVIVTSLVVPGQILASWYYATDPTHVVFYSERTIRHIAAQHDLVLVETNSRNCVVLRKVFKD